MGAANSTEAASASASPRRPSNRLSKPKTKPSPSGAGLKLSLRPAFGGSQSSDSTKVSSNDEAQEEKPVKTVGETSIRRKRLSLFRSKSERQQGKNIPIEHEEFRSDVIPPENWATQSDTTEFQAPPPLGRSHSRIFTEREFPTEHHFPARRYSGMPMQRSLGRSYSSSAAWDQEQLHVSRSHSSITNLGRLSRTHSSVTNLGQFSRTNDNVTNTGNLSRTHNSVTDLRHLSRPHLGLGDLGQLSRRHSSVPDRSKLPTSPIAPLSPQPVRHSMQSSFPRPNPRLSLVVESPAPQHTIAETVHAFPPSREERTGFSISNRTQSDTSLYTPMRRRSLLQHGIATRSPPRRPPPVPLASSVPTHMQPDEDDFRNSYNSSTQSASSRNQYSTSPEDASPITPLGEEEFEWLDCTVSPPRVDTPDELDYRQIGNLKLGSLRITNGAASPASSRRFTASPILERRVGLAL